MNEKIITDENIVVVVEFRRMVGGGGGLIFVFSLEFICELCTL